MNYNNIVGNTKIKNYLNEQIKNRNILHSYLFIGTEAIGKLMIAKEFSKDILCLNEKSDFCNCKSCISIEGNNHPDFCIINEQSETIKIDQIRHLTNKILEKPILSEKKIYIVNDCEKMTVEAQNCLLKTLEEPPEFAVLILIVSNENLLLNTIKSRCMKIKFSDISNEEMKEYCEKYLNYANITLNRIKSFNGSIGTAIKFKENEEEYNQIEKLIDDMRNSDIATILQKAKIIYNKERIIEFLDYMINYLYNNKDKNEKYLYCIEYVSDCISRMKFNGNFDMNLDMMIIKIWEVLNNN